jgi:2-alkyl-3-oxoalkanoate reductase
MTVMVTGGNGFLGGAIVRQLLQQGDTVRSFSRQLAPALVDLGVEQRQGDLADAAAVAAALEGCDLVYHVAAKAGVWGKYREYHRTNVVGTENILTACRRHGIRRLVFTSSPSVVYHGVDQNGVDESEPYPRHFLSPYPRTKARAEQLVLEANSPELATVALRPHLIWGPGDPHLIPRIIERARAGKLRRIGRKSKLVDTIFVENAAAAHLQAGHRLSANSPIAGQAYFLSQGEPLPLWDFINRILALANLPPVEKTISVFSAYNAGRVLEWVYRLLGLQGEPPMTRFVARQLSTAHWFNLSRARHDLGFAPAISIEEGLRRVAEGAEMETWVAYYSDNIEEIQDEFRNHAEQSQWLKANIPSKIR